MKLDRIVVATDFSDVSLRALEAAFSLDPDPGATLYLLHVIDLPIGHDRIVGWMQPPLDELCEEARNRLANLVPKNWARDVSIECEVLTGTPAKEIARFAREKGADMIVIGTHGRTGLARMLMGSTAESLLREAPCQVLVVKPHAMSETAQSR